MVNKGQILGPRPAVNKNGSPRKRPGKNVPADEIRAERLVLRVHPDLQDMLTMLARERGISRSQYVERILLGWLSADPRNPKLDAIGKKVAGAQSPHDLYRSNGRKFGEKWAKFSQLSTMLLGQPALDEWITNFEEQSIPATTPLDDYEEVRDRDD
jgi:hypothetical protein